MSWSHLGPVLLSCVHMCKRMSVDVRLCGYSLTGGNVFDVFASMHDEHDDAEEAAKALSIEQATKALSMSLEVEQVELVNVCEPGAACVVSKDLIANISYKDLTANTSCKHLIANLTHCQDGANHVKKELEPQGVLEEEEPALTPGLGEHEYSTASFAGQEGKEGREGRGEGGGSSKDGGGSDRQKGRGEETIWCSCTADSCLSKFRMPLFIVLPAMSAQTRVRVHALCDELGLWHRTIHGRCGRGGRKRSKGADCAVLIGPAHLVAFETHLEVVCGAGFVL